MVNDRRRYFDIAGVALCLFAAMAPSARAAEATPARVWLDVEHAGWGRWADIRGGLLTRELVRQAVLIAARDEMGLATRDASLGEPRPTDPGVISLRIHVGTPQPKQLKIELILASASPERRLLAKTYEYNQDARFIYQSLARLLEPESRTTFVEALRDAGAPQPVAANVQAPDLTRVHFLQQKMDVVSQLTAVRRCHEQLSGAPGSAEPAGALARGYANLALLTQEYWNAVPQAFAGRALLYAERAMQATNESDAALANRVYVRGIVGMHDLALRDLERLQTRSPDVAQALPWMPTIEAYCRYDRAGLQMQASRLPELSPLAMVLRAHAANGIGDELLRLSDTSDAIDAAPEAYGLYPPMMYRGSVRAVRTASSGLLRRLHRQLPARLRDTAEMPGEVHELAAKAARPSLEAGDVTAQFDPELRRLADAVAGADEEGEPPWAVLAGLLKEELFLAAAWHFTVHEGRSTPSTAAAARAAQSMVSGHPYEPYVASFAFDRDTAWDAYRDSLKAIDLVDARPTMRRMYSYVWTVSFPNREDMGQHAYSAALRQRTFLADEMGAVARLAAQSADGDENNRYATIVDQLRKISPHHPAPLHATIAAADAPTAEQLAGWEAEAAQNPAGLALVGRQRRALKQYDAAVRCYEASIAMSAERTTFEGLADAYLAQGREDLWLATLERYFAVEDPGLGHAQIRNRIALELLGRGRASEAEPYAREAAKTRARWALETASEVCERMEHWDESEKYVRNLSTSYGGESRAKWYLWRLRTGRGDPLEALPAARTYLDSPRARSDFYGPQWLMAYHSMTGNGAEALKDAQLFETHDTQSSWAIVHTALLATELKNLQVAEAACGKLREKLMAETARAKPADHAALEAVVELLSGPNGPTPTPDAIDVCLESLGAEEIGRAGYVLGRACELTGYAEAARHAYRRAATEGRLSQITVTLAAVRLRELAGAE